jgi:hypothetical protein
VAHPAHAGKIVVPDLPPSLRVDAPNHPFLVGVNYPGRLASTILAGGGVAVDV